MRAASAEYFVRKPANTVWRGLPCRKTGNHLSGARRLPVTADPGNGPPCASNRRVRMNFALILAAGLFGLVGAASASASSSHCVDCHTATPGSPMVAAHLAEWQHSAHATHDVGCERCHGGDPEALQPQWAHRGIVHSSRPNSSVNRANLFRTCAPCHRSQAGAFADSLHRVLLEGDDLRAPSCSTCHGSMTARVPSPAVLEARCAECHPPSSTRGQYPAVARAGIEEIARCRTKLAELSPQIADVDDPDWRRDLRAKWDAAHNATDDAVTAFHGFDLKRMTAALDVARRETESVRSELER
jgi:hypothetical protein